MKKKTDYMALLGATTGIVGGLFLAHLGNKAGNGNYLCALPVLLGGLFLMFHVRRYPHPMEGEN